MRGFCHCCRGALAIGAVPLFAQPATQAKPAAPATPGQTGAAGRTTQASAPAPAQPAAPASAARAVPAGREDRICEPAGGGSVVRRRQGGQAPRCEALTQKKQAEIADKTKALQASQQKAADRRQRHERTRARGALERRSIVRRARARAPATGRARRTSTSSAGAEGEFRRRCFPCCGSSRSRRGLHLLLNVPSETVIWGADGLDLTLEAVARAGRRRQAWQAPNCQVLNARC